ncbi:helix-turn-helix domain-containing protein [Cuneatibacter caecimuris]|uniref:HTH cro/C1-type domain-containing protein n=1 Tax=Cuneatibacter caecimuris TaxID=1796618 RepID=A0A4Q7PNX7_9FIRM|nr:helix-turn-helix transcriptional regulator [Cuneatibacter caecimuris]RZT02681.1 hypothetical protein EV209_0805 [Cuneatibacter caecimuris]
MDNTNHYEQYLRTRITELRLAKDVSEHRMSLDLGKSGSYIRGITSGASLPSVREFFNICGYFNITPMDFFAPMQDGEDLKGLVIGRIREMGEEDLKKVRIFMEWISR